MAKEMDFSLMKATDLSFNKRITVPEPMDNETEICMQHLKSKLNTCTKTYIESQQRGVLPNLSVEERRELTSLEKSGQRKNHLPKRQIEKVLL